MFFRCTYFIILFLTISCNNQEVANHDAINSASDCKFFLFPILQDDKNFKQEHIVDSPNIINNCYIIKKFLDNINNHEIVEKRPEINSLFIYRGFVTINDSVYKKFYLSSGMKYVMNKNNTYKFNISMLKDHLESINPYSSNICIKKVEDARRFVKFLDSLNVIIPQKVFSDFFWEKYNGSYTFKRGIQKFSLKKYPSPEKYPDDSFEKLIKSEFNENFVIERLHLSKDKKFAKIKIVSDSLQYIPDNYRIDKGFDKFDSICFRIINESNLKIDEDRFGIYNDK